MQITWYGHSAFRLDFSGHAVLIDPFFTGNPSFKSDKAAAIKGVSHIVLTHGHGDHVGDTLDIARQNGATVTGDYDLLMWLGSKGLEKLNPMNSGGTTNLGGFTVSMVRADHSSGDIVDGMPIYLGNPHGVIIKAPGEPILWHLGDVAHQLIVRQSHGTGRRDRLSGLQRHRNRGDRLNRRHRAGLALRRPRVDPIEFVDIAGLVLVIPHDTASHENSVWLCKGAISRDVYPL